MNIGTASEMYELATSLSYYDEVEELFVGSLITTAANSGEFRVICQHKLSDTLEQQLLDKGYEITHVDISNAPQYIISWKSAGNAEPPTPSPSDAK